jgi:dihydrofolate synthase/folylpolyglutamate synthase
VIKLLSYLGSPQNPLTVFHVTGSNGKWSVCQMISQVLYKQFGRKVGLFTSPHLIDITERFQINWKPITHIRLNTYYKKVINLAKKYTVELSFFEIQVVAMILYFSDERVDYAVVEVGLWWLYDGTNIFESPLACFITSITLEHTHLLGKTRTSVLKNKLGIVKKWAQLYTHLHNK